MTHPEAGATGGGVYGSTFHGPAAIQSGPFSTQHVQFVHQWKPAYRIEEFPAATQPVSAHLLAEQPSRLLRAVHQVVPFTGRHHDLDDLAHWRDDSTQKLSVRLVHGPGGQGKTRLAAHFAGLSSAAGWTVWQAAVNEADADPIATSPPPNTGTGILLVIDYAERWPTPDLHRLLQEPLLHRTDLPVRILLLARPAGIWWESLATWIGDTLDAAAKPHPLLPLADDTPARATLFRQARDHFADNLGLHPDEASRIGPPSDLDTDEDYAQVLTLHMAALAAVDAQLHQDLVPNNPAHASAYLIKRERSHWSALHQRPSPPLSTTPEAMGRTVLTATLTRPLARTHGQSALDRIGLADSTAAANTLLDDHRYCYPPPQADPARTVTVLEPLYPDRLGEDFLGLTTPASPDAPHPVPGAVTDDWAHQAAERLLHPTDTNTAAPWTRDALTVLIETARRWPHFATGQLYPLLKNHPQLALHAGGTALAALAGLDSLDLTVLEVIEPHLPKGQHTDLDVGIAAITARLARHRLATTHDPATRARILDHLSVRQHYAGLRNEALAAGQDAVQAWRDVTRTNPAHEPDLAISLGHLGGHLLAVGRREEALTTTLEAVDVYRRLAQDNPAAHEPGLAGSLVNLGLDLSKVGRREEALTTTLEAVELWRRLAQDNPAAHEHLATSLANLGMGLSAVGRREEALTTTLEAVDVYRRLAQDNPAAHEPDLARALTNLGAFLSKVERRKEALTATEEAVELQRRLAAGNPAAHEPDLALSLSNLGGDLWAMGRWEEALIAALEAVDVYRRLAQDNPAAHEPDLARALTGLGVFLSQVERREEALTTTLEAVDVYRRLAQDNPAAHEPDLARALTNLGVFLSQVERREEAIIAAQEAVDVYRRLAAGNPAAHEPGLADSLTNLGMALSEVGLLGEALAATLEAVEIRRRLIADNPAAHEPDLAISLTALGKRFTELERREEALAATLEAVEIRRRLIADNPAAHEPDLADSLTAWAWVSYDAQQDLPGALQATGEAVEIYRRLVTAVSTQFLTPLRDVLGLQANLLFKLGRLQEARDIRNWLAANDPGSGSQK